MFRKQKTAEKLGLILNDVADYDKDLKRFVITIKGNVDRTQTKKINKLGLEIEEIVSQDDNGYCLFIKKKSKKLGIIMLVLAGQVVLFSIQTLFLASKTNLP